MIYMDNCIICNSQYKEAINEIISNNGGIRYIYSWCQERGFKVKQAQIKEHIEHSLITSKSSNSIDIILLPLSDIIDKLNIEYSELIPYFLSLSLNPSLDDSFDLIEIMKYLLNDCHNTIISLESCLSGLDNIDSKDKLSKLRTEKLEAQIKYKNVVNEINTVKLKQLNESLIPVHDLESQWSYSLVGFKAKLESIPNKVSLQLSAIDDVDTVRYILTKLINEALDELDN